MLYTVAGECAVVVRDSPFGRTAIVQAGGVNSVQIGIAKCEGVVAQSSAQGHDSNTVIADCNLITSSNVDRSEEVAGGSNTQSLVATDDDVLLAGNELIGSIHLNEGRTLDRHGNVDRVSGAGDSTIGHAFLHGDGLDGHGLANSDSLAVNGALGGGLGTIGGVVDGSTLGLTSDGHVLSLGVLALRGIKGRSGNLRDVDGVGCAGDCTIGHILLHGDGLDGHGLANGDSLAVNGALGGGLGAIGGVVDGSALGLTSDGHVLSRGVSALLGIEGRSGNLLGLRSNLFLLNVDPTILRVLVSS